MNPQVIAFIGETPELVSMFTYLFDNDLNQVKFDNWGLLNGEIPRTIADRIINLDEVITNMFCDTFAVDKEDLVRREFFDYKHHDFTFENIHNSTVINTSKLYNLEKVAETFGTPDFYPFVKLNKFREIYKITMEKLFGEVFLYKTFKLAYDKSNVQQTSFITGLRGIEDVLEFRRTFSSTGIVVDLTGVFDIPADYRLKTEIVTSNNKLGIFYHMKTVIKFIRI